MSIIPDQSRTYFANETGAKLANALWSRWNNYRKWLESTGRLELYQDMASTAYGMDKDGRGWTSRKVQRSGKDGEVLKVKVNHLGALEDGIVTIVTAKALGFQVYAANTDSSTNNAASAGMAVLEHLKRDKDLDQIRKSWVRHAARYGLGYVEWEWIDDAGEEDTSNVEGAELTFADEETDPLPADLPNPLFDSIPASSDNFELGTTTPPEPFAPPPAQSVKMRKFGDIEIRNLNPLDCAYNYRATRPDQVQWRITRNWVNRYDLAAEHPELAGKIHGIQPDSDDAKYRATGYTIDATGTDDEADLIPVYRFMHEKSKACPNGKEVKFLNGEIILSDGPLNYPGVPVERLACENMDHSGDGRSRLTDLLAPQEANDAANSLALSKQHASLPRWWLPENCNVGKKDLGRGFSVLTYRPGANGERPQMDVPVTHPEQDVSLAQYFQNQMETLSGVNSVMRGNPEQALKGGSGRAYAFIQAQAAVINSGLEGNTHRAMGRLGLGVLKTYGMRHKGKQRLSIIAGKALASQAAEFSGEELKGVGAVTVDSGDPLTNTPAGRMELTSFFKEQGVPLDFSRLYEMAVNGNFSAVIEDTQAEDIAIAQENEAMARGEPIPDPAFGENFPRHILRHLAEVSRPDVKMNPQVSQLIWQHVQKTIELMRTVDPLMLAIRGIPVPPGHISGGMMGAPPPAGPGGPPPPQMGSGGPPTGPEDAGPAMPTLPDGGEADPFNQGPASVPQA